MRITAMLSLAFGILATLPVAANTITQCGASTGYRYDLAGPVANESGLGWESDKISNGKFSLIKDGDSIDIITTDAVGTRSSRADGAEVVLLKGDHPSRFVVLLAYSTGLLEHFLFSIDSKGVGEVVWGTARPQGQFPKSSLMRAACKSP